MKKLSTLTLMLLVTLSSFADVSNSEKTALVKFYQATKGFQWTTKWDLKAPVATWYGVKIENDHVVGLTLTNNNLNGELPIELFSLEHLQELNLFKNTITGVIPSSISNLKELRVLNLSFNKISGNIPY